MQGRPPTPTIVAVNMGYGHLRPAAALAEVLRTVVSRGDLAPLADSRDRDTLARLHAQLVFLSRASQVPLVGPAMRRVLDAVTWVPRLRRRGELAAPNAATRHLRTLIDRGFGAALADRVRASRAPMLSTFYAQAIAADARGVDDVHCLTTDSDVNRVWVAHDPRASRIRYCVPLRRTARRLEAYGVPSERIHLTGFPLPPGLVGGPSLDVLHENLARRLLRLDPSGAWRREAPDAARRLMERAPRGAASAPVSVTFAIGGAGAQAELACALVRALREPLARGAVRLTLVAGVRREVASRLVGFARWHAAEALRRGAIDVLHGATFQDYLARFEVRLARTDVLVTKPSEMIFYGALGLALVLAPPLGHHERANGRLARRKGFGLEAPPPSGTARWLEQHLADGSLARAAWSGYARMPKDGTYRIARLLAGADAGPAGRSDAAGRDVRAG